MPRESRVGLHGPMGPYRPMGPMDPGPFGPGCPGNPGGGPWAHGPMVVEKGSSILHVGVVPTCPEKLSNCTVMLATKYQPRTQVPVHTDFGSYWSTSRDIYR